MVDILRLPGCNQDTIAGETAVCHFDLFKIILKMFPDYVMSILSLSDKEGNTIASKLAKRKDATTTFIGIVTEFEPLRLKILKIKNADEKTVADVLLESNFDAFKKILDENLVSESDVGEMLTPDNQLVFFQRFYS